MAKEVVQLPPQDPYNLAICAMAGDESAKQELYEMGLWPQAREMAQQALTYRYKKHFGELPDEEAINLQPSNSFNR